MSCAAQSPLVGISVANAVLSRLFVRTLFNDDFRWRPWHAALWFLAWSVGTLSCGMLADAPGWVVVLPRMLLRAVPVAGALLAIRRASAAPLRGGRRWARARWR
jgi:hypothetical protein